MEMFVVVTPTTAAIKFNSLTLRFVAISHHPQNLDTNPIKRKYDEPAAALCVSC